VFVLFSFREPRRTPGGALTLVGKHGPMNATGAREERPRPLVLCQAMKVCCSSRRFHDFVNSKAVALSLLDRDPQFSSVRLNTAFRSTKSQRYRAEGNAVCSKRPQLRLIFIGPEETWSGPH
jgi:hypothetical protein